MSTINDTHRTLAKASLGMMAQVYDDVVKKHNPPSSGKELYELLNAEIFQDELPENPIKTEKIEKTTKIIEQRPSNGGVLAKDVKNAVKEFSHKSPDAKRAHRLALPYLPEHVDYSTNCCSALELQGGLLTPCMTRPKKGELYCTGCLKSIPHGTIADREKCTSAEFVNPEGKKAITYGTYLALRNVPREFVESWLTSKFGDKIVIPDSEWAIDAAHVEKSKRRERSPSTSSDEEGEVPKKRGRGRPKKVVQEKVGMTPPPSPAMPEMMPNVMNVTNATEEVATKVLEAQEPVAVEEVATKVLEAQEPVAVEEDASKVLESEEPVAPKVTEETSSPAEKSFKVISETGDQEFLEITVEADEEVSFVQRVRVKSTGKYYGVDEDGDVYEILGKDAPLVTDVTENCDHLESASWDVESGTIQFES